MEYKSEIKKRILGMASSALLLFNSGCEVQSSFNGLDELYARRSQYEQDHRLNLNKAYCTFDDACLDGKLSVDEQRQVLEYLALSRDAKDKFTDLVTNRSPEKEDTTLSWNEKDESYWFLLNQNINGIDAGTPEFQEYLVKNGIKTEVEGYWSQGEQDAADEAVEVALEIIEVFLSD